MQKFSLFLAENTIPFDSKKYQAVVHAVSDAPTMRRYIERYQNAIVTLQTALENKLIYNTEYGDMRKYISDFFENATSYLKYTVYRDTMSQNQWEDDFDGLFSMVSARKYAEHFKQFQKKYPLMYPVAQAAAELSIHLKTAKGYIQKGRKPSDKPIDPNAFVKPMLPLEATKQVQKILQDAVSQVRSNYIKSVEFENLKKIDQILAMNLIGKSSMTVHKEIKDESLRQFAYRIFKYSAGKIEGLVKDKNILANQEATKLVDEILMQFIAKNTSKLALLFEKKEKLAQSKILHNTIRNNILENRMYFEFSDNSSFEIYSNVEYGYSKTDKMFIRIPTRFTNVKLADGTFMKGVSEEKMIKEF